MQESHPHPAREANTTQQAMTTSHTVTVRTSAVAAAARHFGLMVSLASAYRRHVEHETMRRKEREVLVDAPSGRVEIEGEILTAKVRESQYGITLKLLLMCDGEGGKFKVWVSAPKALTSNETEPGVRVRMTATLKPSPDDASFAFGSRPAKAKALTVPAE